MFEIVTYGDLFSDSIFVIALSFLFGIVATIFGDTNRYIKTKFLIGTLAALFTIFIFKYYDIIGRIDTFMATPIC